MPFNFYIVKKKALYSMIRGGKDKKVTGLYVLETVFLP